MSADTIKNNNYTRGFYTPPPKWKSRPQFSPKNCMSEEKNKTNYLLYSNSNDCTPFHVIHKVPSGDSPYVKAKHAQLIEKDPSKAVALFWNAINSGDRIDSALKDMAVVMKQLDRSNEAIEAIRSFRHLCSSDSQESLDNVLLELYKRSGRLEEQIEVLQLKLKRVEEGNTFGGKKVKLARCHGKKVHITVEQEYARQDATHCFFNHRHTTLICVDIYICIALLLALNYRLLGNMAWAYLQQNDYTSAEEYYRKALSIEPDKNKQCNLAICLMCTNRITEAKILLQVIQASCPKGQMDESYGKSFERASQLLAEIESQADKSSFASEQNYCCQNVAAFTPYRKLSDDPLDQKHQAYYSMDAKRTYTPSNEVQGIPKGPFTQPKIYPSLLDSRKTTCKNGPVKCLPRRLQFENPTHLTSKNSKSEQQDHLNTNMSVDSSPAEHVLEMSIGNKIDKKENVPPAESEQHDNANMNKPCGTIEEWMFQSNKSEKSWADMVEEDEQELNQSFFQTIKYSRNNRLQVFQDITPGSPCA
ncbi:Protein POLLENLESS 3 [Bienertia sinuspersici]